VEQLARAVHAAHRAGVVHRDLKPANVLLLAPPGAAPGEVGGAGKLAAEEAARALAEAVPKVGDFGLGKPLGGGDSLTASGTVLGTPEYMAPEQALGRGRQAGPACDVHALGAILYRLLTGRPPFVAETTTDLLLKVAYEEPLPPRRLWAKVPRDLETICLKCLSKKPSERYDSAEELAEDFRRFQKGEPVLARREGPLARGRRWCRKKPALASLAAALLFTSLTLVIGTPVAVVQILQKRDEADARAAQARKTRDRVLKVCSDLICTVRDELEDRPGLHGVREALLRKAIEEIKEVLRSGEPPLAADPGLAVAYDQLGQIAQLVGRTKEAGDWFDRSRTIWEALVAEEATADRRRSLGKAHARLAEVDFDLGNFQAAKRACEEALRLYEALPGEQRDNLDFKLDRAEVRSTLWVILYQMGEGAAAAQQCRMALELVKELPAAHPNDRRLIGRLSFACGYLAAGKLANGDLRDARESADKAVEHARTYFAKEPREVAGKRTLAWAYGIRGEALLKLGDERNGLSDLKESCALYAALADLDPQNLKFRYHLSQAHRRLASASCAIGRRAEAETHSDHRVRRLEELVRDDPRNAHYKGHLASAYYELADCHQHSGRLTKSLNNHLKSLKTYQGLLEPGPHNVAARAGPKPPGRVNREDGAHFGHLAAAHVRVGSLYLCLNDRPSADRHCLGEVHRKRGDVAACRRHWQRYLTLALERVELNPSCVACKFDFADGSERLGDLCLGAREVTEARRYFRQAVNTVEGMVRAGPGDLSGSGPAFGWAPRPLGSVTTTNAPDASLADHLARLRNKAEAPPGEGVGNR
jgi:tetratricopeptide (TPR) repeat protein